MSDTENTKTTPKEKKPRISDTYVKLNSYLFYALAEEDPEVILRIMEKMCALAPVEEQIEFFNNLCSNKEKWHVLISKYRSYVNAVKKAEKKAAKAAEAAAKKAEKEAATSSTSDVVVEAAATTSTSDVVVEEEAAPAESSSEEKPKKKKSGKKKKSEEATSEEVSA